MCSILCVTDQRLCPDRFLYQLTRVAAARPAGIILREKDLAPVEYIALARQVLALCRDHQVPCILHSFPAEAQTLGADAIHLPLPLLRTLPPEQRSAFVRLGTSCHSVEEAREAQALGCTYLMAGHIFETSCKAGLPGRGLDFLSAVCKQVSIPVYAIGGISPHNFGSVRRAGATGACLRSGLMTCEDPAAYLQIFCEKGAL